MHKYRLAVCEDDKIVRDEICRVCDETLTEEKIDHEITSFSSAEQMEKIFQSKGQVFDLLILDIQLENKTGMELAKEVREWDEKVSILFITGYTEYAVKGYSVRPIQFLLKPLDWEELKRAVMTDWRLNHRPQTLLLEKGRRRLRLPITSILYVETDGKHGTLIILKDGKIEFPARLTEMGELLPAGQFVRCHNSYIVNLEHVQEAARTFFCMDNGEKIPISRKYYSACQNAFISYINR